MSEMDYLELLIKRYPALSPVRDSILAAYETMKECYENGGTLLVAGNGGSCADSEHIVGELMKGFVKPRRVSMAFAQQLNGYGRKGDVFLGISTSGNSANVLYAMAVAKAKGIRTIALTGRDGGAMGRSADVAVIVPETETYMIQELHLPVYHALCLMLADHFFK